MEKSTIKNIILTYGAGLGIVSILISVFNYTFSKNYLEKSAYEQIIGFILIVVFIVLGVMSFKKSNNSYLSLTQSFKIGLGISLISALITILYIYIFSNFIEVDFKEQLICAEIKKMNQANTPKESMNMAIEMMKNYMFPMMYFSIIIIYLIFGLLVSLFTGLVLKKEDNKFA